MLTLPSTLPRPTEGWRSKALSPMQSALLCRAFEFAMSVHGDQVRKGHGVPFISHPMAVSALVIEAGGDPEEAAAALLHDTLEDTTTTPQALEELFGSRVAGIVLACTDNLQPCPPGWRDRKARFILCIRGVDPSARLVIAADKLHNARDVVRSQRELGDGAFKPFWGGKDGTVWYYRAALTALEASGDERPGLRSLLDDLRREVVEMERLASLKGATP